MPSSLKASLFDLDGCLSTQNLSFAFMGYLYSVRELSTLTYLKALFFACCFQCGWMSLASLHQKAFTLFLQGRSEQGIKAHARDFIAQKKHHKWYAPAIERLKQGQKEGQLQAICSSSASFLLEPIGKYLKVEHLLATSYQVTAGVFTSIEQIVDGKAKASYVGQLLSKKKISPKEVAVYSDSFLDIDFLTACSHPVAVNPDGKLLKWAKAYQWPIL